MRHTHTFIDLFAGLGGFNIALSKSGAKCVFASEINPELNSLYRKNFKIECHGDITKVNVTDIPTHDILCAGFPCQPFSKAGHQKGLSDLGRGDMIYEIIRILKHHQPKYFILENVPNIKTHDNGKTWDTILQSMQGHNYNVQDFVLSPHQFGVPHTRERIFIVGTHHKAQSIAFNFEYTPPKKSGSIKKWLLKEDKDHIKLNDKQIKCLGTWQEFINSLPKNTPLPKFPIWAMEFGANYPLHEACPFYKTQEELGRYKGAFGCSLKGFSKEEQLHRLPIYARYKQEKFPQWKINYIQKNRKFWDTNKSKIKRIVPQLKNYINSWQKLEWNAGDESRDIFSHLLQFRSSGVRIKSNCSIPSLVLTGTQTPIIGWEKRYLTLKEAQKLQGFEEIAIDLTRAKTLSALGNAVNTIVVENIVKEIFKQISFETQKKISIDKSDNKPYVCA